MNEIPITLYIHFPWCVQKCPYCDFNSHPIRGSIPEEQYCDVLLLDLEEDAQWLFGRTFQSVFFGGGTPSLISGEGIASFLERLRQKVPLARDAEITLEANPGVVDAEHFSRYGEAGINRLSLGVQSFRDEQLEKIGRIHSADEAESAFHLAREAGFRNINIDLMFGLPGDSLEGSLSDLKRAIELQPEHISWYQLTIEPNTLFYQQPPQLPEDDRVWSIQQAGQELLAKAGYRQYEISAYAREGFTCHHNLNYWTFGDYIGIGAGAHSKVTRQEGMEIKRYVKPRHPKQYLDPDRKRPAVNRLKRDDIILEYMMNILRLKQGFTCNEFESRTGLPFSVLTGQLEKAERKKLIQQQGRWFFPTLQGEQFLNDLLQIFTP